MNNILKTFVWHREKCFMVSTCNRQSSAAISSPPWYAETLVWTYVNGGIEEIIWQGDAPKDSIRTHQRVVEDLYQLGRVTDPNA